MGGGSRNAARESESFDEASAGDDGQSTSSGGCRPMLNHNSRQLGCGSSYLTLH